MSMIPDDSHVVSCNDCKLQRWMLQVPSPSQEDAEEEPETSPRKRAVGLKVNSSQGLTVLHSRPSPHLTVDLN